MKLKTKLIINRYKLKFYSKKILALLFMSFLFIGCEQAQEQQEDQSADSTPAETKATSIEDVSNDYFGEYHSLCTTERLDNEGPISMQTAKIVKVSLDYGDPVITVEEYAEADCRTLLVTRKYEIDHTVELALFDSGEKTTLKFDYTSSSFTLNHSAYDGYNSCGFVASTDTEYLLNSPCQPNLDGKSGRYSISDQGNGQYKFTGSQGGEFTLTKQ